MRYEDASQSGSSINETPDARDDADALAAGSRGPATGNVITGSGTQTGSAGADIGAENAKIVEVSGAGGRDSSFAGGKLAVDGQFGRLSIDGEGNYSYLANRGAPENSRDEFSYKLADGQGRSDSAALIIEIGKSPAVVQANAQRVVPGPDGTVVLPAGVQLSDVNVVGRNLVIDLPGGGQMVIIDGAIFVPRLVFGDVEVPATSLAALLIGSEIRPAAGSELGGENQSSGGNFELPVSPLDPGIDLGDLIPPTELAYIPPEFRELSPFDDDEPEVLIQTPDQPAGAENATALVYEEALPARTGEPAGSNSSSTAETTTGTIVYTSNDTPNVITVRGVVVTAVGQVIPGTYGDLTITSIADGAIGYSYTLGDNTIGDATSDLFTVIVTDRDGDQDTATLTVSIIDDVPVARADVDSVREEGPLVADGNVVTGSGGLDANATDGVADTPGADGITVTAIAFGATGGTIGSPLAGAYGSLVLGANGNYVYTLNNQSSAVQALGVNESLTEVFTYSITDGDGDVRSTTLTITINGTNDLPTIVAAAALVSEEGLASGNPDNVGIPSDGSNSATATGQLTIGDIDGDALSVRLGIPTDALTSRGQPISWALSGDGHVLTGSANGATVITVTVTDSGGYTVVLSGQVDHPNASGEDVVAIAIPVTVGDGLASASTTLVVSIEDDSPIITSGPTAASSVTLDETDGADPLSSGPPLVATSSSAIIASGVSFGADGPGTATVYGLTLQGGTSIASGLQTALGDQPITLTLTSSTLITGTYNGGTQTAFTIQMNTNGTITVTQFTALEHLVDGSTAAAYDDALSLVVGGVSLVNATATYFDFDGDSVTGSVGIGGAIVFEDDGPSIDVTANTTAEAGVVLTTTDDGTEGAGSTTASTATGNFGGIFGLTFTTGADGAAVPSLTFALSATTAVSGLTSQGVAINLYNVGGVVIGSTALVAPASVNDPSVVFAVSVGATGIVTLTQYQQIDHSLEPGLNDAPFADQLASLADGAITLTASSTIVDNDGDSASDSETINIGANLRFADDGPDIAANLVTGATIRIDETDGVVAAGGEIDPVGGNLGTVTVTAASLFSVTTVSPSADAPTTLTYALSISAPGVASGLLLSTTNEPIVLVNNGGVIEGRVATTTGAIAFTVSIDATTGATTLTQFLAVEHGDTSSNDEDSSGLTLGVLSVNVTATDYDGDTDVASADLGSIIRFEDDGPTAVNDFATQSGEDEDVDIDVFGNDIRGSDGALASSVQLVPGSQVGGGTLTNNGDGTFTLDPLPGQTGTVTFNYTFIDNDGDPAIGLATITLAGDSTPGVVSTTDVTVDEDGFAFANDDADPLQINPAETDSNESLISTGTAVVNFGNDVPIGTLTNSITLVDTPELDGQLQLLNGAAVTFALVGGVLVGSAGATEVIRISITGATAGPLAGQVSYTYQVQLLQPLEHAPGSGENSDFLNGVTFEVTDSDGDQAQGTFDVTVVDDVPTAAVGSGGLTISHDETVGNQGDANDVTGPLAVFAGVTNPGDDLDVAGTGAIGYAQSSGAISSSGTVLGADGGTSVFSLNVSSAGVDSGLNTTSGQDIVLFKEGALIVGRVLDASGAAAFAVSIDPATGQVSMVQYLSLQHPNPLNPDEPVAIASGAILATVTATDGDGDVSVASTGIGNLIGFQDDGPRLLAADNINIQNSGDVAHTGTFSYNLGVDGAPTNNDVFKAVTGSATVNGVAVTNYMISQTSEDSTSAVFTFSFDYPAGSQTVSASGTLTFNKAAGTYTVDLAAPISSVTLLDTAGAAASAFVNYNTDGTTSNGPSEIATVELASNLFIQFTGDAEPGPGTGDDNLFTTQGAAGAFTPVTTANFAGLELFTQDPATVTVSSSAAGVAGNTIQGGEVLDFNLYNTNVAGNTGGAPTASANSLFIQLDGIGGAEDMIVVLKLYDTVTGLYTTQALLVQNADIITSNAALAGTIYSGIVLDGNDGLIVIEANDYQGGNTNLVIVGAQIAGSDEGITGTATNFNGVTGDLGASSGTQNFSEDVSNAPFKISNLGFVTASTTPQTAELTFNVTIQDGDFDTVSQTLVATVNSSPDSSTPIAVTPVVLASSAAGDDLALASMASFAFVNDNGDTDSGLLSDVAFRTVDREIAQVQRFGAAANSAAVVTAAVAAMGLAATQAAADGHDVAPSGSEVVTDANGSASQLSTEASVASEDATASPLGQTARFSVDARPDTGNADDHAPSPDATLSDAGDHASHEMASLLAPSEAAATQSAVSPVAPMIVLASAEAFEATAGAGNPGGKNAVVVQDVLKEALDGGAGGDGIDAILASLPDHAGGQNAALEALASPNNEGVSGWDMGAAGHLSAILDANNVAAMNAFHHDAVQPAING